MRGANHESTKPYVSNPQSIQCSIDGSETALDHLDLGQDQLVRLEEILDETHQGAPDSSITVEGLDRLRGSSSVLLMLREKKRLTTSQSLTRSPGTFGSPDNPTSQLSCSVSRAAMANSTVSLPTQSIA